MNGGYRTLKKKGQERNSKCQREQKELLEDKTIKYSVVLLSFSQANIFTCISKLLSQLLYKGLCHLVYFLEWVRLCFGDIS